MVSLENGSNTANSMVATEMNDGLPNRRAAENSSMERPSKRQRHLAPMTQWDSQSSSENIGNETTHPPGFIKKVQLRNFMCHEHFELELGPRLNFIVGNNGSGKSAVLTAITIGLGAKATDTNRGSSLKDLIREGCQSSKISIVLNNEGFGGYDQGTYGSEIRIERTIKRNGPATFSLKSENGKEVSNKKRDLQVIVDYFAVPVMNPMCFLSQDAARSFLTASTPTDKYKHFMRGTLLEDTEMNLDQALQAATTAQNNLDYHAENVKLLRQDFENAKKVLKELNANQDLNGRKRVLQGKLLWLSVVENEKSKDMLHESQKHLLDKISKTGDKIKAKDHKVEQLKSSKLASEQALDEALNTWQEKKRNYEKAQSSVHDARMEFDMQKEHKAETQKHIEQTQSKIAHLDTIIEEKEEEMRKQIGGDKNKMREEAETLKIQIKGLNDTLSASYTHYQELKDKEHSISLEAEATVRKLQRGINNKTNELREASQGKMNFLSQFDPNMEKVVRLIEQRKSEFSTQPIGPLGAYVTLKSEFQEWAKPIQRYLDGTLSAFVVSNAKDNALLKKMFASCRVRNNPNVITYSLSAFNFESGRANSEHPTVSDALEFKSKEFQCLFIDQNRIEKVLLIRDKDQARRTLLRKHKNVSMTISLRDSNSGYQCSLLGKSFRLDTIEYQDKAILTTRNPDFSYLRGVIREEERELSQVKEKYSAALNKVREELREEKAKIEQTKAKITVLSKKEAAMRIDLEKEIDTGFIEQAQLDKQTYVDALTSYNLALDEVNDKITEIMHKVLPLKERSTEASASLQASEMEISGLRESISSMSSKLDTYLADIEKHKTSITAYEHKTEELRISISDFEKGIKGQISNAEIYCPRESAFAPDMPQGKEDTVNELERITTRIQMAENRVGLSQDEAVALFENAKTKYRDAEKKYADVDRAIIQLNESLRKRLQSLNYAKTDTCVTADTDFKESLRFRNFSGGLNFDFSKGALTMLVKTPNDDQPRNVDTLSGGEKSFSQTSLLLATWRPMRSRIIALDEFDVFMDQVNRQIGTKLIMNKLSKETRTQTIIITPQDIGKIADFEDPGIRIHKMKDPERQNNSNYFS